MLKSVKTYAKNANSQEINVPNAKETTEINLMTANQILAITKTLPKLMLKSVIKTAKNAYTLENNVLNVMIINI